MDLVEAVAVVVAGALALAVAGYLVERHEARAERRRRQVPVAESPWTLGPRRARVLYREWRERHDIRDGDTLLRRIDRLHW
jgi:hypothetical protein